jgi:hypothetical protein
MVKGKATMDRPIADSKASATGQRAGEKRNQMLGNPTNIFTGSVPVTEALTSNSADFRHSRKLARPVQICLA